jgi:hypothetical protein
MAIKKTSQLATKAPENSLVNEGHIKSFIHNADKTALDENYLDPDAIRNYKQLSVRLNEYEYKLLEKYSKKVRRSIADSMRDALIEKIKVDIEQQ